MPAKPLKVMGIARKGPALRRLCSSAQVIGGVCRVKCPARVYRNRRCNLPALQHLAESFSPREKIRRPKCEAITDIGGGVPISFTCDAGPQRLRGCKGMSISKCG